MIIMNEEITNDPYDNNVRRKLQKTLMIIIYQKKLQKTLMIIMNEEIIKDPYDNNERKNYKRPLR